MTTQSEVLAEVEAVREAGKTGRMFLRMALGYPLEQVGGLLGDEIRHIRFKQQMKILDSASEIMKARGLTPDQVKGTAIPEVLLPLIDGAETVSDQNLGGMFAQLLAASIDPKTALYVHPGYVHVLKQMSPVEARLMKIVYDEVICVEAKARTEPYPLDPPIRRVRKSVDILAKETVLPNDIVRSALINLKRLGVCNDHTRLGDRCFELSEFGLEFLRVCYSGIPTDLGE